MPRKKSKPKTARVLAFGPAPVLAEEDHKAYDDLLMQVSSYVKPTNIVEDMWVRDVVDLTWEIFRYRRCKKHVIEAAVPRALERVVTPHFNDPVLHAEQRVGGDVDRSKISSDAVLLVQSWLMGSTPTKEIREMLIKAGLSMDDVMARAIALEIDTLPS